MTDPRLLHILLVYYEPFASGQTTHVMSLVKGINKEHFKVQILLPTTLRVAAEHFRAVGAEVFQENFSKTSWGITAIVRLFKLVMQEQLLIVHFHSQEAALLGRFFAKIAGAKHIFYTPQTIDIRQKRYMRLYTIIEKLSSLFTEKIISVNEADRIRLISWGISPSKVITIYNGIALDTPKSALDRLEARSILGIDPDCPLIMQIGRLSDQKSPVDFIEGAKLIVQTHPNTHFVMIGDGPLLQVVKQKIYDLQLDNNIKVLGSVENASRLIPAADVVTLTSAWEGTPYTILEAMAFAKPVVATSVNGCPEIIDHNHSGFLVSPGDHKNWAYSVIEFIDHPQTAYEFGVRGKQKLEMNFTLPTMIQKTENLYMESIGGDGLGENSCA